jgi:hypothetical protein
VATKKNKLYPPPRKVLSFSAATKKVSTEGKSPASWFTAARYFCGGKKSAGRTGNAFTALRQQEFLNSFLPSRREAFFNGFLALR